LGCLDCALAVAEAHGPGLAQGKGQTMSPKRTRVRSKPPTFPWVPAVEGPFKRPGGVLRMLRRWWRWLLDGRVTL